MKKAIIIVSIVALLGTAVYFYYKGQAKILEDQATYELTKIQLKKLDMDDTALTLQMKITNPSNLQAQVTKLDIDLYLNDKKISKIIDSGSFVLPAKGFTFVDLQANFSPNQIYGQTADILQVTVKIKDATIAIKGAAKVLLGGFITFNLPVEYSTSVRTLLGK
jgi:LEA14-like dessication related protein